MLKRCTVCGEEKELSEFGKRYKGDNRLLSRCKECASIAYREWRLNNLERRKENKKEWYENNIEHVKQYDKERRDTDEHRKQKRTWDKTYYEKNKDIIMKYVYARRQNLGYNELNDKFPGSVGHHINKNDVIYIPEEIHKSIQHKQGDEVSMSKINELAINFLCGDM